MLVGIVGDVGHGGEVLLDEVAEDAVALAVEDAHAAHAHEDGVVEVVCDGIEVFLPLFDLFFLKYILLILCYC